MYQKAVAAKFRSKDPKDGQEAYLELAGAIAGQREPDPDLIDPKVPVGPIWKRVQEYAEQHNAPGKFTTFIAFEWSSTPENSQPASQRDLRRYSRAGPAVRFDGVDAARRPVGLSERARAAGSDVIAIPHNANLSNGLMFRATDSDGKAFTREYAQRRLDMEPLRKSSSSRAPPRPRRRLPAMTNSPTSSSIRSSSAPARYCRKTARRRFGKLTKAGSPGRRAGDQSVQVRTGRRIGLAQWHGGPRGEQLQRRAWLNRQGPKSRLTLEESSGRQDQVLRIGAHGVWAEENTRESIFAALKRKETFGTSGTFIRARLFGGWSYAANFTESPDWVKKAYAEGVPMGSDLPPRPGAAKAPTFVVAATKDLLLCNLDRIQIVKGWLDAKGQGQEKIYDVALSDGRTVDAATGKDTSRWEIPWTSRRRAIPTTSATRSSWRSGRIVSSTLPCRPSTTRA